MIEVNCDELEAEILALVGRAVGMSKRHALEEAKGVVVHWQIPTWAEADNITSERIEAHIARLAELDEKLGEIELLVSEGQADGRELIRFVRSTFPDAHFPIIALSGAIVEQLGKLDEIGADYFITKGPMEKMAEYIEMLIDKIEE